MELNKLHFFDAFSFNPDKNKILRSLHCYKDSPVYREMSDLFDQLVGETERNIKPKAVFLLGKKHPGFEAEELSGCNQLVYCLITLGKAISAKISAYFSTGRSLEGMISDAIANTMLFNYSRELYTKIAGEMKSEGLGLTKRLTPGESSLDIVCQKQVLKMLKSKSSLGVTMTDGYMLSPVKSLAYVYGADKNLLMNTVDHDCSSCPLPNCNLRETPSADAEINLTVVGNGEPRIIKARTSRSIHDTLAEHGIRLNSPCGGRGTCGKCAVSVLRGTVFFRQKKQDNTCIGPTGDGVSLACCSYPMTDCTIDIELARESVHRAATTFVASIAKPDSGFQVVPLTITAEDQQGGDSVTRLIDSKLGRPHTYALRALKKIGALQHDGRNEHAGLNPDHDNKLNIIIRENTVVDLNTEKNAQLLGLGIDIGTTTVVLSLVDLVSGRVLETHSLLNNQRQYGADVISRIQHSAGEGLAALQTSIRTDILKSIRLFSNEAKDSIHHVVIAGNTTMLHFLLGLSAESLGLYPFQPVTTGRMERSFAEVFADNTLDCMVTVLPGVSAYVGADIVAGLLHCRFVERDKIGMLIDIGTNGEMAIGTKKKIICLSTAAGPAFEAATITCGTGSVAGAISTFSREGGKATYTTIDEADPVGICGSGVIDIMAACLREKIVDQTGRFDQTRFKDDMLPIAKTRKNDLIFFNQKDVREVQLAKSAIRSGIDILLKTYGCGFDEIETVYFAGAFGMHINIENAVAIGLIPRQLQAKVSVAGNSSLGGAIHYLLDQTSKKKLDDLLRVSTHMNLANDPAFNDLFISNMQFSDVLDS